MSVTLRPYRSADCPVLAELFYQTVHGVCGRDYTPEQLDAWAHGQVDLAAWDAPFRAHTTLVAQWDGLVAGFADLADDGYLDRLYVHKDLQGRGIATAVRRPARRPADPRIHHRPALLREAGVAGGAGAAGRAPWGQINQFRDGMEGCGCTAVTRIYLYFFKSP